MLQLELNFLFPFSRSQGKSGSLWCIWTSLILKHAYSFANLTRMQYTLHFGSPRFSPLVLSVHPSSSRKRHLDPDDKGLRSAYNLTIVEHIEYTSNRNQNILRNVTVRPDLRFHEQKDDIGFQLHRIGCFSDKKILLSNFLIGFVGKK
jgi:hypothetical protein